MHTTHEFAVTKWLWRFAAALLTIASGCSDLEDSSGTASSRPWDHPFQWGNLEVNSVPVGIFEDGVSLEYAASYVAAEWLPQVQMQYFKINLYLPTDDDYVTYLTETTVVMSGSDGFESGDIYSHAESAYVEQQYFDGQLYSVYRLVGFLADGIAPQYFENIVFRMNATYERDGVEVGRRTIGAEVYRRDEADIE